MLTIDPLEKNGKPKKDQGFSLVELVIVIAIIGILAALASISIDFMKSEQVSGKSKELLADFQRTRMIAMSEGPSTEIPQMRGAGLRFLSSGTYIIFKYNDCNQDYVYDTDTCTGSTREEAETQTLTIPTSLEVFRVSGGSLTTPVNSINDIFIFDRMGMLRLGTDWSLSSAVFVVKHKSAPFSKCISVESSSIREGDWNGSTCTKR